MKHFYQQVPGWFDFQDLYAAQVARLGHGAHVVEVGTFLGKSTAHLAVEIANSRKQIRFDSIDTFTGVPEPEWAGDAPADQFTYAHQEALRDSDGLLVSAVRANLAPVADRVNLIVGDSLTQAATYADGSLDFVFLDDDHSTAHVRAELDAWWPKLKPDGVLAGHDFDWPSVQTAVAKQWSLRIGRPVEVVSARCWSCVKPQPSNSWLVPPHKRKCLVAVCCNERNVPRHTVISLDKIGWGQRVTDACKRHDFQDVEFAWFERYLLVSDLRDEAATAALFMGCSHILFLDADMTWPLDVLDRMLAHHGHGIVSGLYHLKSWPHWPIALRDGVWNHVTGQWEYTYDKSAPHTDALRQEELVGMGCTLVPVEVFRRYERPWFKYGVNDAGYTTITEDVYFCQQAAAVGCPIWLDPTIDCGHVSQQPITSAWYDRATVEMVMLANGQRLAKQDEAPVTVSPNLSLVEKS